MSVDKEAEHDLLILDPPLASAPRPERSPDVLFDFVDVGAEFVGSKVRAIAAQRVRSQSFHATRTPSREDIGRPPPLSQESSRCVGDITTLLATARGIEAKVGLLDATLRAHDGSLVLQCLLCMQRTLHPRLFFKILSQRPAAAAQLRVYFRARKRWNDLDTL